MINKQIEKIITDNNYIFFHKKTTTSTMLDVKNYLKLKNKNCICISDKQTAGRGRRGNLWHSPEGNIYCSISFENFLELKENFFYNILVGLSIKMSLEKFHAKEIKFKWPNDLLYKNSKFCGILSETYKLNYTKSYMIVGFGLNINSSPKIDNYLTTYAKLFCDLENIFVFLEVFFQILFLNLKILKSKNRYDLIDTFIQSLMFKNENISILLNDNTVKSGIFKGINSEGALQLKINNNIEDIYNGTII